LPSCSRSGSAVMAAADNTQRSRTKRMISSNWASVRPPGETNWLMWARIECAKRGRRWSERIRVIGLRASVIRLVTGDAYGGQRTSLTA
jgi:hypothetical protein